MIGGIDVVIPTRGGAAALDACLRAIGRYWPQAVFENALDSAGANRYEEFSIGSSKEVFAYRDRETAAAWDEEGADPALGNTMIHTLLTPESITLVVDDPDEPTMSEMLQNIKSTLQLDKLNGSFPRELNLPAESSEHGAV